MGRTTKGMAGLLSGLLLGLTLVSAGAAEPKKTPASPTPPVKAEVPAEPPEPAPPTESAKTEGSKPADVSRTVVAPLMARDLVERLKTLRSEIVLEEEGVRLLRVQITRLELENQLAQLDATRKGGLAKGLSPALAMARAPRAEPTDPDHDLIVKAVTVRPFKEAIVTYRGRVYTVRPGDTLGNIDIRDINESGVVTGGAGAGRSVLLGR